MVIDFSEINERLGNVQDYLYSTQDFALLPMPAKSGPFADEAKARAEYTQKVANAKKAFDKKMEKIKEKQAKGNVVTVVKPAVPGKVTGGITGAALSMSDADVDEPKVANVDEYNNHEDLIQGRDPDISNQQNLVNDILACVHDRLQGDEDKKYTKEVLKKLRNPTVLSTIADLQSKGVPNGKIVSKYTDNILTKINGVSDEANIAK